MLTDRIAIEAIERTTKSIERQMRDVQNRIQAIKLLENEGLDMVANSFDVTRYSYTIERGQLPQVRRAMGRLTVVSKEPSYHFDDDRMLDVTVRPLKKEFSDLRFRYKTKYRSGGRCKVVAQTTTWTDKKLVCS